MELPNIFILTSTSENFLLA